MLITPPELPTAPPITAIWPKEPVIATYPPALIVTVPPVGIEMKSIPPAIWTEPSAPPGAAVVAIVSEPALAAGEAMMDPACMVSWPARIVVFVTVRAAVGPRITGRKRKFNVQLFPIVHGPVMVIGSWVTGPKAAALHAV